MEAVAPAPAPAPADDLEAALARVTAPGRVSTSPPDRLDYARDLWPRGLLAVAGGEPAPYPPQAIVWPTSTAEVQAIVELCGQRGVPIVPFGAGSGVCGGTVPVRGGVVVDMKRMRRLAIDGDELTARVEAGILGSDLERALERRGFTLGHFPSSIMISTVGGWLAARSAGQCSSRYGKIEDMVRGVELVTGAGQVLDTERDASGPPGALEPLLIGSEGTLGLFTRATLRIHPAPEARLMRGFRFARLESGCEAIRRVMQRGLRPSVVRLYDPLDTAISRLSGGEHAPTPQSERGGPRGAGLLELLMEAVGLGTPSGLRHRLTAAALAHPLPLNQLVERIGPRLGPGCKMIVGCEGPAELAAAEARAVWHELEVAGGEDLGPGPGERWLRHRYDVSFGMSKVFQAGAFADTMEVATTWERLLPLYRAVRAAVAPHAFTMAHFSHAYEDGCSIYFTFAAAAPPGSGRAGAEQRYDELWRAGLAAAASVGATVSHHHGVGLSKAAFLQAEHGQALRVFRALKRVCDPHGIMNPGKLGT